MTPSRFDDHMKIAIRCWARDRGRQMAEKALKVSSREMEYFLTELLTDALMEFDRTYNAASNEYIRQCEAIVTERLNHAPFLSFDLQIKPDR